MEQASSAVVFAELSRKLPTDCLFTDEAQLGPYSCDALTMFKETPLCAVLPRTTKQVADVIGICHRYNVPVVARGAGTGLSGGALPHKHGVLLVTARLNSIVRVDPLERTAIVQPGVTNFAISDAASRYGLFYPPDPSSQIACSIGGNIAENAGGVRCLKYGLTVHNIISLRCISASGKEFEVGGPQASGYDLLALVHGSEGMLAMVVEATVALTHKPDSHATMLCAFDSYQDGGNAVAQIIAKGIVPAGLEMMDQIAVDVVEEYMQLGYPKDAKLVMICECDGLDIDAQAELGRVIDICNKNNARDVRQASSATEREKIWKGRKSALPAVGRHATDYYCMDGTIPRRSLGNILEKIAELSKIYELTCASVFHAGDGNLHPLIMFHAGDEDECTRAKKFGSKILRACLDEGGTITGEHGVGIEKLDDMCVQFNKNELQAFEGIKRSFDPEGILNPGKAIPTLRRCAEFGAMHVHDGKLPHPELECF